MTKIKTLICSLILFLLPVAVWAGGGSPFSDKIREIISRDLGELVYGDVSVTGLRIVSADGLITSGKSPKITGARLTDYRSPGKAVYTVSARDRDGKTRAVVVEASYVVSIDVYVTARPLSRGTVITSDDVYPIRQKSSRLPLGVVTEKREIIGRSLKRDVGQGVIIKKKYLIDGSTIKRGRKVKVLVQGKGLVLTTMGKLMRDATVGGMAKVLCDSFRQEVSGVLVSPDTVVITL